jgi:hypothetical protein
MIDISKPLAATRESLALTRATLARIDGMWRARTSTGRVVRSVSVTAVLSEVAK